MSQAGSQIGQNTICSYEMVPNFHNLAWCRIDLKIRTFHIISRTKTKTEFRSHFFWASNQLFFLNQKKPSSPPVFSKRNFRTLSSSTLRPRGPKVTATVSANLSMPRSNCPRHRQHLHHTKGVEMGWNVNKCWVHEIWKSHEIYYFHLFSDLLNTTIWERTIHELCIRLMTSYVIWWHLIFTAIIRIIYLLYMDIIYNIIYSLLIRNPVLHISRLRYSMSLMTDIYLWYHVPGSDKQIE